MKYTIENGTISECLNIIPLADGSMKIIEPSKNAVIVQMLIRHDEEGKEYIERLVSIECKDMNVYPTLQVEAIRILNT